MTSGEPDELSLQEIEHSDWGDPATGATGLVRNVLMLRRVPLRDLGVEGLRELIGQQVSLDILIPRALDLLEHEPRVAGDFYPGDLLAMVLSANSEYWAGHARERDRVDRLVAALPAQGEEVDLAEYIAIFRSSIRPAGPA